VRYRLILPEWAKKDTLPPVVEGYYSQEELQEFNKQGYNIYWMPNSSSKKLDKPYISGKDIDNFEWCFVDCDLKDGIYETKEKFLEKLGAFPLKPTMTVDSGNGIHAYWNIADLNRDKYIELQFRLIQEFQTDDSVWTPFQLMRLPGTLNTKDQGNPKECVILENYSSTHGYDTAALELALPPINETNQKKMNLHIDKLEGRVTATIEFDLDLSKLPTKFIKLLAKEPPVKQLFEDPRSVCGDRSTADMKLCNILYNRDFSKDEAMRVLCNTLKARSRSDKETYASNIVEKVYSDRAKNKALNLEEWLKANLEKGEVQGERIKGPEFWDVTHNGWRRGELLGIVAGTGVGKSSCSFKAIKDTIDNDTIGDTIHFIFTLEMPVKQVADRWLKLTNNDSKYNDKIYIVGNTPGKPRIGPQHIYHTVKDTCKSTGKKAGIVVIDHFRSMSHKINMQIYPNFDAVGETGTKFKTISIQEMCRINKELAVHLDCFLVVQNQSSKSRAQQGDMPMGVDAAYGAADFEWYCDYLMTVWQPLKLVQDKTELYVTAWQYSKIREGHPKDKTRCFVKHLLHFDPLIGEFRRLSLAERATFDEMVRQANELRRREQHNRNFEYKDSPASVKDIKDLLDTLKDEKV